MPRIGWNPARGQTSAYRPPRVTLAVLTYLPEQTGYFQHRLDVTRLCLESLIRNTPPPYDLLVFDNGSCGPLVDYLRSLRDAGRVHYLILSERNIGKLGALKLIARFAPGEVLAYTDDDVFFLPGWLEAHLRILDTYPNAAQVTGFYFRPLAAYGIQSTLAFAESGQAQARRGYLIPPDMEQHYIDSMGRTADSYTNEVAGLEDVLLDYRGVQAYVSAGHHQFVARREAILQALPQTWEGHLMGRMRDMDAAVDRLGYLRLSTAEYRTRLLGNALSPEMVALAAQYGIAAAAPTVYRPRGWVRRVLRWRLVQAAAYKIYQLMFQIINSRS
jgi:glycosyltransferase involved in cell wall biosynthesis